MTDIYYKVLSRGHRACHGGNYRYMPNRWTKRLKTESCKSGYHVCTVDNLARWLFTDPSKELPLEVWECEAEGVTDAGDKSVCERIRLTRLVGTLDEYDLRWLGTIFAESVLHNTDDPRAGECINAVRAYCCGFLDKKGLSAAWSAAESAAWNAAESAAAAWSAAWSAAESAAGHEVLAYLEGSET